MRTAVEKGDAQTLHRLAHPLKSSSAMLGAKALAAHYRELDHCGRTEQMNDAEKALVAAEAEFTVVEAELSRYRDDVAASADSA